jgi:hypothetical protein
LLRVSAASLPLSLPLTVALSRLFMSFSNSVLCAVINPSRAPGATTFEKLSTRTTRPSASSERKVRGGGVPGVRVWRK